MQSPIDQYLSALGQIESSGNYNAVGPQTRTGDRAYGKYQVMGANVPAWTKMALGRSLSPSEFLSDPDAQDAVARKYFGSALDKYGNPQDAASVWFSGRPQSAAGNASDGYNTVGQYVGKFNKALSDIQGGSPLDSVMSYANADTGALSPDLLRAAASAPSTPNSRVANGFASLDPSISQTPNTRVDQGFQGMDTGAPGDLPPAARVAQAFAAMGGGNQTAQAAPASTGSVASDASPAAASSGLSPAMMGLAGMGTALRNAGAGLLSIYNPAGAAMLQNAADNSNSKALQLLMMSKPQWSTIGTDRFGKPVYGFVNPLQGTVNGQPFNASGVNSAASGDSSDYGSLSKDDQSKVDMMLAGRLAPPNGRQLQTPYWNQLISAADEKSRAEGGPGFDSTTWTARNTATKSMSDIKPNSFGGQMEMARTILSQMGELATMVPKLGNSDYGGPGQDAVNYAIQQGKASGNPEYQTLLNKANTLKEGIANEMSRLLNNGNVSEATRNEWRQKLDLLMGNGGIHGAMEAAADILADRLNAGAAVYNKAFGTEKQPIEFMDPASQKTWKSIKDGSAFGTPAAAPAAAAPSGGVVDYRTYFGMK